MSTRPSGETPQTPVSDSLHVWLYYYRNSGNGSGGWFYNYGTGQNEWR